MDFTKALTYPFEDPDWVKKLLILLVVGLFFIIPVVNIAVAILIAGWEIETALKVKAGDATPLASWDDFGGLFSKGLVPWLGALVHFIPAAIFFCGGYVAPLALGAAAASSNSDNGSSSLAGAAGLIGICCICVGILAVLAGAVLYFGGYIRYMDRPEFGTFMQFGENFGLVQSNTGDFGMALLFMIGAGLISSVVAGTVIGSVLAIPFNTYFRAHVIGQLAAKLSGAAKPNM